MCTYGVGLLERGQHSGTAARLQIEQRHEGDGVAGEGPHAGVGDLLALEPLLYHDDQRPDPVVHWG